MLFTGTLTDWVGLLLLTAVGWFIRAIAAVAVAVAVVAGRPDTPAGPATMPLVIATFCTQHSYQLGHVGVNNLPRVSKPSRSRCSSSWPPRCTARTGDIATGHRDILCTTQLPAGTRGVNNLPRVSKPSRSRWWSAGERETLGGHTQWRSNGVGKMGKVQPPPRVQGPPSSR